MELVTSCIGIFPYLWDHSATQINFLRKLKENLNSLSTSMDKLKELRNDVTRRVEHDEANPIMKRKSVVAGWLQRVEAKELEVADIIQQGNQQLEARRLLTGRFCCCCTKNCCTGYKLGKKVVTKIESVKELRREGDLFDVVVDRSLPDPIQEQPTNQVVGMESKLAEIWRLVTKEDQVRILGLYGMGGVGKTTLLKKLNNEFLAKRDGHDFDLVIWVVVSKDVNFGNIQKQIGDFLGLSWGLEERGANGRAARDIFNVLSRKKFVVLLDDIWERLDLQSIGIPPLDTNQEIITTKVVFTTRSKEVCGSMEANEKIRVECLKWDEAWALFQNKVGQEALECDPKIPKLAEIVAKECGGLPLALIVIGRTMATKTTPQQWQYAVSALKKSAFEFSGMGDKVLPILKFSYDNLENDKLKSCFLYCSLYHEDHEIGPKELIDLWIGEGFLSEFDDIEEARNEGQYVIGCLLGACLLESYSFDYPAGMVFEYRTLMKMHDVVRDLAIWVASDCGRKKGKFLVVQPSTKLKLDELENAEKISVIDIDLIRETPKCLYLSTMLLRSLDQCSYGRSISDDFFTFMPRLKVLSITEFGARGEKLPMTPSISSLLELEYLRLNLDVAFMAAGWLKYLVKLKYLHLICSNDNIFNIKPGEIACLTKLQMLDTFTSSLCNWEVEDGPSLKELEGLKSLNYLGIAITMFHALKMLVSSEKLRSCTRRLHIRKVDYITTLSLSPPPSSSSPSLINLANMIHLKELCVYDCPYLEELRISWVAADDDEEKIITLLTSLEMLVIKGMPKLKIVWDIVLQPHHQLICCFQNLHHVEIRNCGALKDVSWIIYAQCLKTLALLTMDGLEEVIYDGLFAPPPLMQVLFSKLRFLELGWLPNLQSICVHPLAFPSLESIKVWECPQLKKLPLDSNSARNNTLRRIQGDGEWWESLEWEDEFVRSTFVPYFKETSPPINPSGGSVCFLTQVCPLTSALRMSSDKERRVIK